MHPPESTSAGPSPSVLLRLEQVCDAFEDRWRRGERPRIEDYLAGLGGAQPSAALRELLAIEAAYRRQLQESVSTEDYRPRFPEHAHIVDEVLQVTTTCGGAPSEAQSACAEASPATVGGPSEPQPGAESRRPTSAPDPSGPETVAYETPEDAADVGTAPSGASLDPGHSTVASADRGWQTKYDSIRRDPIRGPIQVSADETPADAYQTKPSGVAGSPKNSVRRSGHYLLQSQIGRGGLGCVFLARDPTIGRKVAIKEMRPEARASAELVARFREEAQITGQLEHPNVVPIYELGDLEDGTPYYAMRLLGNQTLGDAIKRFHADKNELAHKRLALDGLLRAFVGVCQAMAYAHKRKVLHRDLKPINIMLGDFGEVFVLDWGLAKVLDPAIRPASASVAPESTRDRIRLSGRSGDYVSSAGSVMGTLAYMSPEQAQGRIDDLDARSDVFALGAILYEILLGRPPYSGKRSKDVLAKAQKAEFTPPRQLDRHVPRPLEAVCLRAMALDPDDRYDSAADLAAEITRWQADEPVQAYREPWRQRCRRWARRHRTTCGVVLTTAIALLVTLGWWSWRESARVAELRTASVPLLLEGQRKLAEEDVDGARLTLSQVQARVGEEPALADVRVRLEELLEDAEKRLARRAAAAADQQRLARFDRAREEALAYATLYTGLDLKANLDKARQTAQDGLALFDLALDDVKLDDFKLPALTGRHYSAAQQSAIRTGCQELLLIYASALCQPLSAEVEAPAAAKARMTRALDLLRLPEAHAAGPHTCRLLSGKCYLQLGEKGKAALELEAAQQIRPTGAQDAFFAGLEAFYARQLPLAKKRFHEASQADAAHFWAQYFLAVCHLHEAESDENAAQQAIAHLSGCLQRRPDFLWTYLLRGHAYGLGGAYANGEADFEKAVSLDKDEYAIYVNRGAMRLRQGNLKGADQDLHYAMQRDGNRYQAYLTMAQVRIEQERKTEAKQFIEKAIERAPGHARAFALRAELKRVDNDLKGALEDLGEAIRRETPGTLAAGRWHLERGRLFHRLGELKQAKEAYDAAVQAQLDEALVLRGLTLMELRERKQARDSFDAFLTQSRSTLARREFLTLAHRERGLLRGADGDDAGALEDYVTALALAPANPKDLPEYDRTRLGFVRARRGWLLLDAKLVAEQDFDQVIKLDPKSADAYNGRGFARVLQGRCDDAVRDAEQALRLAPKDAGVHTSAAFVYAQAARFAAKDPAKAKNEPAYRLRALKLLAQGIGPLPPEWRAKALADPALDPIRNTPEFRALATGGK